MFKKLFYLLLVIFLLSVTGILMPSNFFAYAFNNADYIITDYDVVIDVSEENVYSITETITAEFNTFINVGAKHGIYRYIPKQQLVSRDVNGKYVDYNYQVKIKNINVNTTFIIDNSSLDYLYIQIGDEDITVNGETITYIISYDYILPYDRIETYDDFYFNLVGDGWDTDIENFTFTVNMPKAFNETKIAMYTGIYGSEIISDNLIIIGNSISNITPISLYANEAVTVRLELENDYFIVTKPSILLAIIVVVIISGLFAICVVYALKSRKTTRVVPTVEFYPPEKMNPSELAYILNGIVRTKDMTALIIYWANKGALKIIVDENNKISLQKISELPDYSKDYERNIFALIFAKGSKVNLDSLENTNTSFDFIPNSRYFKSNNSFSTTKTVGNEMYNSRYKVKLEAGGGRYENKSLSNAILLLLFSTAIIILPSVLQFLYTGIVTQMLAIIPYFIIFLPMCFFIYKIKESMFSHNNKLITIYGILGALFAIGLMLICYYVPDKTVTAWYLQLLAGGFAILIAFMSFNILNLKQDIAEKMGKIIGFKNFIITCEQDRMRLLLKDNPQYYFDILPYAYVLDITNEFASKFKGLEYEPPKFVTYSGNNLFDLILFSSIINNSFNSFSSRAVVSATSRGMNGSSSGGFGGGFSGGGFGGGGGGSW
ncbi:MAG: DUF2207 domain-containing protein [Clostridia bacterium]|jgi:uncharacterized membrane protein YgcG